MDKAGLAILEKAFDAEVASAFNNRPHLIHSKSKVAKRLAEDGYLSERTITMAGRFSITVTGYELTHLGRLTYCATCTDPDEVAA